MGLKTGSSPKEAMMAETPGVDACVSAEEYYQISVWSGSDGKFGAGVKVGVTPLEGETLEGAGRRANKFAVAKLREVETLMGQED